MMMVIRAVVVQTVAVLLTQSKTFNLGGTIDMMKKGFFWLVAVLFIEFLWQMNIYGEQATKSVQKLILNQDFGNLLYLIISGTMIYFFVKSNPNFKKQVQLAEQITEQPTTIERNW